MVKLCNSEIGINSRHGFIFVTEGAECDHIVDDKSSFFWKSKSGQILCSDNHDLVAEYVVKSSRHDVGCTNG